MKKLLVCVLLAAAFAFPNDARPAPALTPLPAYCQDHANQDLAGYGWANHDAYSCCSYWAWYGPPNPIQVGNGARIVQYGVVVFGVFFPSTWRCTAFV